MELQQTVSQMDRVAVLTEAPLGPVYSFVPAGSAQHDQRVAEMTRRLVESLQAYLETDGDRRTVLLADFQKDSGVRVKPRAFTITCADLSHANPGQEWLAVSMSEAIFVVTSTDPVSMDDAREKTAWLRAVKRDDCFGLVLLPSPGGATSRQAEDITGLPVCAVIQKDSDIAQLACWIAQE
jgi:hypothetical protein